MPWRIHEPAQGKFNFTGQADLRKFVQLILAQGMYVILRPGPYAGTDDDLGGLPSYLLAHTQNEPKSQPKPQSKFHPQGQPQIQLRQAYPDFLLASARYLGQIMAQIHDLQITSPRLDDAPTDVAKQDNTASAADASDDADLAIPATAKPAHPVGIIMIQAEHQWLCHHPDQSDKYLTQIVRYLRENNCKVPITLSNNLWQQVDGCIDTWHASDHLATDLRQLRTLEPDAPRIVSHLRPSPDIGTLLNQLTSTIAVGGQFNLDPFAAPSLPAAAPGRILTAASTPSQTALDQDGQPLPSYNAIKRVATLASHFGHVLAHAQPASQPAAIYPDNDPDVQIQFTSLSVLQQKGPQGTLIFLMKPPANKTTLTNILLPDGQTLPVPMGRDNVAWIGTDINLSGVAELTLTNLRPWAWIGKKMLVLFGPASAQGLVVIDGGSLTFTVPKHEQPLVINHETLTLVILNEKQVDSAYPVANGLIVNASSLDQDDQPLPSTDPAIKHRPGLIDLDGNASILSTPAKTNQTTNTKTPTLSNWQRLDLDKHCSGQAESYASIDQPLGMESLGIDSPACWYHLKLKSPVASIPNLASPASGGSLEFFTNQKHTGTLTAQQTGKIKLAKSFTILATNPGRYADGWRMEEPVGLAGDLFAIKPVKLPKPRISPQVVDSPLTYRPYLQHIRHEHRELLPTLIFSLTIRSKAPRIFAWENFPHQAMLLVNDTIVGVYDPQLSDHAQQILLEMDNQLRSGVNEFMLAILEPIEALKAATIAPLLKQIKLYETTRNFTDKAELSYAKWELPDAEAFASKQTKSSYTGPCWHRATFDCTDPAAKLQLTLKASPGSVIYLNHQHVGRLTSEDESQTFTLPSPWLHTDEPNELLVFEVQCSKTPAVKLGSR